MSGPMERCTVCGWPMAESAERGCVPGNCSYRGRIGDQRAGQQPGVDETPNRDCKLCGNPSVWDGGVCSDVACGWGKAGKPGLVPRLPAVPAQPPVSATSSKWTQDYIDGRESILKLVDGGFSRMTREQVLAKEPVSALRERLAELKRDMEDSIANPRHVTKVRVQEWNEALAAALKEETEWAE